MYEGDEMKEDKTISLMVNGRTIQAETGSSILEAMMASGETVINNIGCAGQGVCGSCRILMKKAGEKSVVSKLACETRVESGMQVSFLDHLPIYHLQHTYQMNDWDGHTWHILERINEVFPEAKNCRHCGGCDSACPRHLEVQKGVNMAAAGNLDAAQIFDECIMCNLCTIACPEMIAPNHLGSYIRRLTTAITMRPNDLVQRLHQIETQKMTIDLEKDVT